MSTNRLLGIGHLTMLDVPPPDWVVIAATAGFDLVGIRVAPGTDGTEPWPIFPRSPMLAETLLRLDDTGVRVLDLDVVRLTPDSAVAEYRPVLEVGATLSARFLTVLGDDPDPARARDTFAALVDEALTYGLRPMIEPVAYSQVRSLDEAVAVVDGSGGGILVDPLHLYRCGDTPDRLRVLDPTLLPYFLVCDAPRTAPRGLPAPRSGWYHRSGRRDRSADYGRLGDPQLEALTRRLLPGSGELPLGAVVDAMPAGVPVSVAAPNPQLRDQLGALGFARQARRALVSLLASTGPGRTAECSAGPTGDPYPGLSAERAGGRALERRVGTNGSALTRGPSAVNGWPVLDELPAVNTDADEDR